MAQRQPFDPSRIRVPDSERTSAGERPGVLTPRAVNELVRGVLARGIPSTLHVLGEIGDLSRPQSGHVYFSLKDAQSELRCVLWRGTVAKLKFTPEPGLEVIATGGLEVYTPRGTYQLIVRKLEPRGVGALEVAFRQLKQRLERFLRSPQAADFDLTPLTASLNSLIARVASYAGSAWLVLNKLQGAKSQRDGKAVFWNIDPRAESCADCIAHSGKEYKSYADMLAITSNLEPGSPDLICAPNCRCQLDIIE